MRKKYWILPVIILLFAGMGLGLHLYQTWLGSNTVKSGKLFIPTDATYAQVLDSLKPFLRNEKSFDRVARKKNYPLRVKPGRYSIVKNESNNALVNRLRAGLQDEISIRIGNYSSIYELAGKIGPLLECDSQEIVAAIVQADYARGYDTAALLYFFIPETYHFHWNTSGPQFAQKMKQYFDRFWTPQRLQAATASGMKPLQVTILASIVQLESARPDEQPRVARLYLNRLQSGMKLDADPTVIFAMRKASGFMQKIQRVYNKDLLINSPYNTYRNRGLPPGPICMPNASAVDAVLHPAQHDYLYFVADPRRPGYHLYARTLKEQEAHAQQYYDWLNRNQIK